MFARVFDALARETADLSTLLIDTSHVKPHRIAANGAKKTLASGAALARLRYIGAIASSQMQMGTR
ncbi:MAG: hypothetical protein AAGF94_14805 [Pseudomonadota bacterium]